MGGNKLFVNAYKRIILAQFSVDHFTQNLYSLYTHYKCRGECVNLREDFGCMWCF